MLPLTARRLYTTKMESGLEATIGALVGLIVGAVGTWLVLRGRFAALETEAKTSTDASANLKVELATACTRLDRLGQLESLVEANEGAMSS